MSENGKVELSPLESKRVDAWMSQYAISKAEISAQIGFYKVHVRNFQLLLGFVFGAAAFVVAHPELRPNSSNLTIWYLSVLGVPVIATYLALDVLGPFYIVNLVAERMVVIEWNLNRVLGPRVYVSERYASPVFHRGLRPLPGVINPDAFLWFFGTINYLTVSSVPLIWLLAVVFGSDLSTTSNPYVWVVGGGIVVTACWCVIFIAAGNIFKARRGIRPFMVAIADPGVPEAEL